MQIIPRERMTRQLNKIVDFGCYHELIFLGKELSSFSFRNEPRQPRNIILSE